MSLVGSVSQLYFNTFKHLIVVMVVVMVVVVVSLILERSTMTIRSDLEFCLVIDLGLFKHLYDLNYLTLHAEGPASKVHQN